MSGDGGEGEQGRGERQRFFNQHHPTPPSPHPPSFLRDHARTIAGRDQLFVTAFARALEVVPRALCSNAGLDATDILNRLRAAHAAPDGSGARIGVDVHAGGVTDTYAARVWEPALVKANALAAATEAAALLLSVDETVRNPRSTPPDAAGGGGGRPQGRGRGLRR